jgi:CheY-like chemotaxis protein/AraC-like DNA-binding protein
MGILVPPSNGRIDFQPNVSEWVSNVKPPVNAPQLLVVDDNPAIQSYLKLVLQPHFRLLIAKNGQEGLDIAIQEIPDLILTDVMMPVMDGIEMTNRLKSHQLTSHIPVVMLSAKNEIADRIKGQEQGADLYMGKPFNDQELILAIHNLNELQKKWKERYATVYTGTSSLEAAPDMPDSFNRVSISNNDAFMQRVLGTFEKNYANEKFDAVEIAALLNISKAQLYRKISQISEESVMGMLRNYRLGKAVEFLESNPDMSTKEIAYRVGFKEYSHFSASFKKHFNVAPSEWRKSGRKS